MPSRMPFVRAIRHFLNASARSDAVLAKHLGLHITDLSLLELVCSSPDPVSPNRVCDHLGLTSGATTGAIDRIERKGFVRRVPNPDDRRGTFVEPVRGKADEILAIFDGFMAQYEPVFSRYSDEQLMCAAEILTALAQLSPHDALMNATAKPQTAAQKGPAGTLAASAPHKAGE